MRKRYAPTSFSGSGPLGSFENTNLSSSALTIAGRMTSSSNIVSFTLISHGAVDGTACIIWATSLLWWASMSRL